ncbi:MAG TPA: glycosyltransferase family 87 protein [Vulgatibacter sp.]|nr:glycosyltransferase family 87 protein [Vulgatibacter sp.]
MPERTGRIGWEAFAVALVLHLAVVATVVLRVQEKRRGEETPLPRIFRLFNDASHRVGPGADFFALYHAGVRLERDGRIYAWGGDEITPPYYVFRYLPSLAQTAGRAARLVSPWTAYLVWIGLLEVLLVACLVFTRLHFGGGPIVPWLWALWLAYTPLWLELFMGQFSFATGALVFAACVLASRGASVRALLAWIASVAVKIYPVILLPLWWRRGWILLPTALVALLALGNVPGFLRLPDAWRAFVDMNLVPAAVNPPNAAHYGLSHFAQLVLLRIFGVPASAWPTIHRIGSLSILAIALALALRRRGGSVAAAAATLLLAHQVTYKDVWEHHASMVLPMGLLLLRENLAHRRAAWAIGAALVALALPTPFALWDRPGDDPAWTWSLAQRLAVPGAKALPTLVLFAVGLWTLGRRPDRAEEQEAPASLAA